MHCKNCGKEVNERAAVCPNCGVALNEQTAPAASADRPNAGFAVLGFLIPLVGLILYLVWKGTYPLKAKSCGKGALIAVIVDIVLAVIYVIFFMIILSAGACAVTMAACL